MSKKRLLEIFVSTMLAFLFSLGIFGAEETTAPPPSPTPSTIQGEAAELARVARVVDGDTIKLESGETVRYIGIDTPETVAPNQPIGCFGKEASDRNAALVAGKEVRLETDTSNTDRYGRLLRYVYVEEVMINELLVREGYAISNAYKPDTKHQDKFDEAQALAQQEELGLWGETCDL